jgi:hypothetical protein
MSVVDDDLFNVSPTDWYLDTNTFFYLKKTRDAKVCDRVKH